MSCSPEGNSASPVVVQQPTAPTPSAVVVPKWPLKPGVLVHVNGAHSLSQIRGAASSSSLSKLPRTSTPNTSGNQVVMRSRTNKKLWNIQRRRALSLSSLAQADDTSQRSRANRIRKMFSDDKSDSLPSGFYTGKSGGIFCLFLACSFFMFVRLFYCFVFVVVNVN